MVELKTAVKWTRVGWFVECAGAIFDPGWVTFTCWLWLSFLLVVITIVARRYG